MIISPHTLVMLYIIKACSQNNIAFVCLYPNTTISYSHLMLPGFLSKKHGEKLWRIGKDHLRDLDTKVAFQRGISTSYWKLSYPSKLEESGTSFENLVSGFCKCGFVPLQSKCCLQKVAHWECDEPKSTWSIFTSATSMHKRFPCWWCWTEQEKNPNIQ